MRFRCELESRLANSTGLRPGRYYMGDYFDLMEYCSAEHLVVNCYDQAFGVATFSNLLGGMASVVYTEVFGLINTTDLIGIGLCNNPFYTGPVYGDRIVVDENGDATIQSLSIPRTPLAPVDYVGRSRFGNHMYVIQGGKIYDGCAGPELGIKTLSQYLDGVIDHSTISERENGYFSIVSPGQNYSFSSGYKIVK